MLPVKSIDLFILSRNLECQSGPLLELALFSWRYLDCRMASMAILANLYIKSHLVSRNVCILYDYHTHHLRPAHTHLWTGSQFTYGVVSALLWYYLPFTGIHCVVLSLLLSLFKMGRLTQSQKALFLWRSPMSKRQ